jgi:hypothetical protein
MDSETASPTSDLDPTPEQRLRAIGLIVLGAGYMPKGDREQILALCAPFIDVLDCEVVDRTCVARRWS